MKWRTVSDYCIRSDCGRWQIARIVLGARQPPADLYELWKRAPETGECSYVHAYDSAGAAKSRAIAEQARANARTAAPA